MLSSEVKGASMKNTLLRAARLQNRWSQQQLADFVGVSLSTVERAERGEPSRVDNIERLCACLQKTPEQLGLINIEDYEVNRRQANKTIAGLVSGLFIASSTGQIDLLPLAELWADDMLTVYARGITACQDLYYNGNPYYVEAILPLYSHQTALLAQQTGTLQHSAARLASQAYQLACELATDREDFGAARQAGQQAFTYAQVAGDTNLQVNALISLANLGWHLSSAQPSFIRKHSKDALQAYKQPVSLLGKNVTPLLRGRTYAGIAEVYAMRGQFQEAMRAMGLAYEHYPMRPESDPAYPYLRSSRYSLYVFGDAQSRLLLGQPKEADKALIAMQKETNDPQIEPVTKLDMLYY
jgi:transcriptional regulator with XRE-family HTH domain